MHLQHETNSAEKGWGGGGGEVGGESHQESQLGDRDLTQIQPATQSALALIYKNGDSENRHSALRQPLTVITTTSSRTRD